MSAIEIRGVSKRFGATPILSEVDLTIPDGRTTAILGASGSGKTTLLRLIAGFEQADAGTISIGGQIVDDGRRAVRSMHRGVGYVPQDGALFPHLTVAGNVGFGLPRRERSGVGELIDLVGLGGLARRLPHQLSGGQQQRVALARALAIRPRVVLLDEPFSSLDASLRDTLRQDVVRVLAETGTTTVLVTHDQDEALALADQIAVLRHNRVVACADPRDLYRDPPDLATAASLGQANILEGRVDGESAHCVLGTVPLRGLPTGSGAHGSVAHGSVQDGPCRLLVRPEQVAVHPHETTGAVRAQVTRLHYHGHDALAQLTLDLPGRQPLLARVPGDLPLAVGGQVWVHVLGPVRSWPAEQPADHPAEQPAQQPAAR
jgi:iron(III) transport system ATP-binding protein